MNIAEVASNQKAAIILRNVDVRVLSKLLDQQKQEGQAAVKLIEGSGPTPQRGAPEPGKGGSVDVVA